MARYFYDLSIGKEGEPPYFLRPGRDNDYVKFFKGENGTMFFSTDVTDGRAGSPYFTDLTLSKDDFPLDIILMGSNSLTPSAGSFANTGSIAVCVGEWDGDGGRLSNGYYISTNGNVDRSEANTMVGQYYVTNGGQSRIGEYAENVLSSNMAYPPDRIYLRCEIDNNKISTYLWKLSDGEKVGGGTYSYDFSNLSGELGVILNQYNNLANLEYLSIGTKGDPAPKKEDYIRVVKGTITAPDGNPAVGITVEAFHRPTSSKLGEGISDESGNWKIETHLLDGEELYVIAKDSMGNEWNAPIADMIKPYPDA